MSLTEEVQKLRQQNKEQAKEINRLKEENEFFDIKTDGGAVKGKIAFYCATLNVARQGFY